MYRKMFESKKIGPMIGMSLRTGTLMLVKKPPVFQVFEYGAITRSYR